MRLRHRCVLRSKFRKRVHHNSIPEEGTAILYRVRAVCTSIIYEHPILNEGITALPEKGTVILYSTTRQGVYHMWTPTKKRRYNNDTRRGYRNTVKGTSEDVSHITCEHPMCLTHPFHYCSDSPHGSACRSFPHKGEA